MPLHIVLVEPEIPPNTGNIARTCAITNTSLHLVKPLGFNIDDKTVRRAGLDYWDHLDLHIYDSFQDFMDKNTISNMLFVSTLGDKTYTDVKYNEDTMLVFGRETLGLDRELLNKYKDRTIKIPMGNNENLRSLNLSNSAAIVLYEALRQLDFPNLV